MKKDLAKPEVVTTDKPKGPNDTNCPACGRFKSCGHRHVYVIELDSRVLDDPGFCPDRPANADSSSKCYYVGQTSHKATCRLTQHKAKKSRRRNPDASFTCRCEDGLPSEESFTAYNRGSRFVRDYRARNGNPLRPELFAHLNPIRGSGEDAKKMEAELTQELIQQGHYAHSA